MFQNKMQAGNSSILTSKASIERNIDEYLQLIENHYYNKSAVENPEDRAYLDYLEEKILKYFKEQINNNLEALPSLITLLVNKFKFTNIPNSRETSFKEFISDFCDNLLGISTTDYYRHTKKTKYNDGKLYIPTPILEQINILKNIKYYLKENSVMVDWGAGDGNFGFKIASTYNLKSINLVEIEDELINKMKINRDNLKLSKTKIINVIPGDIAEVIISEATDHYLFKPAATSTINNWLKNLNLDLTENPKNIHIFYNASNMADENLDCLRKTSWLKLIDSLPSTNVTIWENR